MKIKQLGISLLEVMLSLSIIAVVLVMATRYFFMAGDSQKLNQARSQISAVMAAASDWSNQNNDLSQLTVSALVDGHYLARTADVSGGEGAETLITPWKTSADIVADGQIDNRSLSMSVASNATCRRLAASFTGAHCDNTMLYVPLLDETDA